MKKIISLFLLGMLLQNANAQVTAFFSRCAFNTPDNKPYMETYISVLGNSVLFNKNANGKYQGMVEIGIIFSQEGVIKASKKYNLMSPEQKDTLNRPPFIDQQRFALDTGNYELEMMITDKNSKGKTFSMKEKVRVSFPVTQVNISDVQMLVSFTKTDKPGPLNKNGFELVPYTSDYYPENVADISFYAEVYNTKAVLGENERYLLSYYIETFEKKTMISKYSGFRKETTGPVSVLLSKFSLTDLPSGNYNLVVEVRDKSNKIVAQKKSFFQRKNIPAKAVVNVDDLSNIIVENTFAARITGKDTIAEYIRSLRPIASEAEKGFIVNQLKLADEKLMQQFFYNFWQARNNTAPEEAWKTYYGNVLAVNKKFSQFSFKGYETDRGRVYLQYGPPDKMDSYPVEPNAYPYEIWIYYTLEDRSRLNPIQRNKQFIFYNRDLSSNNFQILHSDALSEVHDSRWEMKLHGRTVQSHDFEQKKAPEHFGGSSHDEFGNPK